MPGVVVSAGAQRPGRSARQEAEAAYGPPLTSNPPRAVWRCDALPGASTDVSLRGGASPRSRLGRGQRYLTWSGEEPKRHPETEQPPPWRVSPSGQLHLLRDGSDPRFPSPVRAGIRPPGLFGAQAFLRVAARPLARPASVPQHVLGRGLPRVAPKVSQSLNSSFVSPIKVKFLEVIKPFCVILPEIQKPERKVSSPKPASKKASRN